MDLVLGKLKPIISRPIISGSLYQTLLAVNMLPETRRTVEKLGFWFGPEQFTTSLGINIRGAIFGFFIGRIGYNIITNPVDTAEEFKSITFEELRNRWLSSDYITTWMGRFSFQYFCLMIGLAILYWIGAAENKLFTEGRSLDDLNYSVQAGISQNFV